MCTKTPPDAHAQHNVLLQAAAITTPSLKLLLHFSLSGETHDSFLFLQSRSLWYKHQRAGGEDLEQHPCLLCAPSSLGWGISIHLSAKFFL